MILTRKLEKKLWDGIVSKRVSTTHYLLNVFESMEIRFVLIFTHIIILIKKIILRKLLDLFFLTKQFTWEEVDGKLSNPPQHTSLKLASRITSTLLYFLFMTHKMVTVIESSKTPGRKSCGISSSWCPGTDKAISWLSLRKIREQSKLRVSISLKLQTNVQFEFVHFWKFTIKTWLWRLASYHGLILWQNLWTQSHILSWI